MGLLSMPPRSDPKRETGAYIELSGRLYWVLGSRPGSALLKVENCATGGEMHLALNDVMRARLIKPAPELDVPDTIPDAA